MPDAKDMHAAFEALLDRVRQAQWRFALPNAVTTARIGLGVLAIARFGSQPQQLAWWILAFALLDLLDGALARLCRATSPLGAKMDSLADFLNFGALPALLTVVALRPSVEATLQALTQTRTLADVSLPPVDEDAFRGALHGGEELGGIAILLAAAVYMSAAAARLVRPASTLPVGREASSTRSAAQRRDVALCHEPDPRVSLGRELAPGGSGAPVLIGLPAPVAAITIALVFLSGPRGLHALLLPCLPPLSLLLALAMLGSNTIQRPVMSHDRATRVAQAIVLVTIVTCVVFRTYPEVLALLLVGWYAGVLNGALSPRPRHVVHR